MRTLNVLAGSADLTHVQAYDLQPVVLAAAKNPDVHFTTHWGNWAVPHQLELNLSSTAGVEDDRDRALRDLFRTLEFRQALSHLVDRVGISNGLFPQPSTREWYGGYPTGSPMHNDGNVVKYDQERAVELLAGLGFSDSNGDGILNWPAGSAIADEELIIEGTVGASSLEFIQIMEALVPLFQAGGIDFRVQTLAGGIATAKVNSGDWETKFGCPMSINTPFLTPAPWVRRAPAHRRGIAPVRAASVSCCRFEQKIAELLAATATMTSAAKRKQVVRAHPAALYRERLHDSEHGGSLSRRVRGAPPQHAGGLPHLSLQLDREQHPDPDSLDGAGGTAPDEVSAPHSHGRGLRRALIGARRGDAGGLRAERCSVPPPAT